MFTSILFKQINLLAADLSINNSSKTVDRLGTISAFEGLLCFTLFSGSTKSFFREACWTDSYPNSFDLWNNIIKYNHPVFNDSKWNFSEKVLSMEMRVHIDSLFDRLGVVNHLELIRCIKLYGTIRDSKVSLEFKIEQLWLAYFECIPDADYINVNQKWKTSNLDIEKIAFIRTPFTIEAAIDLIFDTSKLSSNQWRKPYLLAFDELVKSFPPSHNLKDVIIRVALDIIGVELIRYHGDLNNFFNKGKTFVKIVYSIHIEPVVVLNEDEIITDNEILGIRILNVNNSNLNELKRKKGKGYEFSHEEKIDAIKGFNTFGPKWRIICDEPRLIFSQLKTRTSENIRNHVEVLKKKYIKEEFYYIPGCKNECKPLTDDSFYEGTELPVLVNVPTVVEIPIADENENPMLSELKSCIRLYYPNENSVFVPIITNN